MEEAAAAYDVASRQLHREFSRTNSSQVASFKKRELTIGKAGLLGVTEIHPPRGTRWKAMIYHAGKHEFLGHYATAFDAALARDDRAVEIGDGRPLNMPLFQLYRVAMDFEDVPQRC